MIPSDIELLMFYHIRPESHPRRSDQDVINGTQRLFKSDLIKHNGSDSEFVTTDKGCKFVSMLANTPLPEERWIDPRDQ